MPGVVNLREKVIDIWAFGYCSIAKTFAKGEIFVWGQNNGRQLGMLASFM